MALALPRYIALKSKYNGKYLRFVEEDVQIHGFLQYSGDNVVSTFTKYEVERAKSGRGDLVHIRSCFNNKYWVRQASNRNWVLAAADEPEEDQSKWNCTLFEPFHDSNQDAFRFRHVAFDHYAYLWRTTNATRNCLYLGSSIPSQSPLVFNAVVDWEALTVLPKNVAFKGDNGKYLSSLWQERHEYLQFSADDVANPRVGQQVFITSDGSVRIKSNHTGRFWRNGGNWIWADSTDNTTNDNRTLFWPVRVSRNVVALRNMHNNLFCVRLSKEHKTNVLNADARNIINQARLEIEEPVLSREIYNVDFRLLDGRIYGQQILNMANADAVNENSQEAVIEVGLSYTVETTNSWDSTVSMKIGASLTIKSGIPFVAEGELKISTEFSGSYSWGGTRTTSSTVNSVYKVVVPPRTRTRVSLLGASALCDVPFSYTQRDTLINGEVVTNRYDDGIYTGANTYDFKYETRSQPLETYEIINLTDEKTEDNSLTDEKTDVSLIDEKTDVNSLTDEKTNVNLTDEKTDVTDEKTGVTDLEQEAV